MTILKDPEGIEKRILFEMFNFDCHRVLEVGCGDGRLTYLYADRAAHVTAIDPLEQDIETARNRLPIELTHRIIFQATSFENFIPQANEARFDLVIFSWSL